MEITRQRCFFVSIFRIVYKILPLFTKVANKFTTFCGFSLRLLIFVNSTLQSILLVSTLFLKKARESLPVSTLVLF